MKSASSAVSQHGKIDTPTDGRAHRYEAPLVVRMKYGEELNGMRPHEDGVSFHSPSPIPEGREVELILCRGTVLVDAEIVECRPILDALGGFAVRARYVHASDDLRNLITEEVRRHA